MPPQRHSRPQAPQPAPAGLETQLVSLYAERETREREIGTMNADSIVSMVRELRAVAAEGSATSASVPAAGARTTDQDDLPRRLELSTPEEVAAHVSRLRSTLARLLSDERRRLADRAALLSLYEEALT